LQIVLNAFFQVTISDLLWDDVGDSLAMLRSNGVTIPFSDAILATLAISLDVEFWTRD